MPGHLSRIEAAGKLDPAPRAPPPGQVLADAIPYRAGVEPLKTVCGMTPAAVAAVCRAVGEAAEGLLLVEVAALRRAYAEMERRLAETSQAAKFQARVAGGGGLVRSIAEQA